MNFWLTKAVSMFNVIPGRSIGKNRKYNLIPTIIDYPFRLRLHCTVHLKLHLSECKRYIYKTFETLYGLK